mgnify:CR=1 FL=1
MRNSLFHSDFEEVRNIKNIYSTKEEVGSILKILLERLNKKNKEVEIGHTCSTCKHRCTETWTTPDWGFEEVWHNWCSLDKKYMETKYSQGNRKHFSEPCGHWEISDYFKEK